MHTLLTLFTYLQLALSVAVVAVLLHTRQFRRYWALGLFVSTRVAILAAALVLQNAVAVLGRPVAYKIYFFTYWGGFAIEIPLGIFILYGLLGNTLGPSQGIRRTARRVFSCLVLLGLAGALASALSPHTSGLRYFIATTSLAQRSLSFLMLAMFILLVIARRSLGLSRSSQVIGIAVGLALLATNDLLHSLLVLSRQTSTVADLVDTTVFCSAATIWIIYLARLDRDRIIPTCAMLSRWNQRSLAKTKEREPASHNRRALLLKRQRQLFPLR